LLGASFARLKVSRIVHSSIRRNELIFRCLTIGAISLLLPYL
jgi:hypothetical protein